MPVEQLAPDATKLKRETGGGGGVWEGGKGGVGWLKGRTHCAQTGARTCTR